MKKTTPYKIIIDAIQDGVFIIVDEKLVYVNDAFCNIIGYSRDEIIGQAYNKYAHEDDIDLINERHEKRMRGEDVPDEYEFRLRHKDGHIVYIIMSIAMADYNGAPALTGTIKDITDRINAELKIREIEDNYKALLELSPDPIIVSDLDGYIIMHNQAAYDVHEPLDNTFKLLGKRVTDFITDEKQLQTIMSLIDDSDEIGYSKYTVDFKTRRGNLIPFELNSNVMYDTAGNPKCTITIGRDISKIKQYENQLKKLIDEKETMIKEIHHRIKNSLQQVHSLLGIQAENASAKYTLLADKTLRTDLCQIQLQKIIEDARQRILAIAIVHQMFYKQSSDGVEFSRFLKELVKNIKLTYENETEIKTSITGDKLELCLDHIIPCGLIANEIISNSFKHAFKGKKTGKINIDLQSKKSIITLSISDNGNGMTEDDKKSNDGLGLSLINGLTEQIDGKISCTSDINGTKYILTFDKKNVKG